VVELPEPAQAVAGQDSHEQSGLVGFESVAARLIPEHHTLSLFDPRLLVAASFVHFHHFPGKELGIGDDEHDPSVSHEGGFQTRSHRS
jgi:hypothetical protein